MSAEQPLILSPKGTPFQTEKAALDHIKKKELDPKRIQPIPYNGRFALLDLSSPKAKDYLPKTKLPDRDDDLPTDKPKETAAAPAPASRKPSAFPEDDNEYSWVRFLPRQSKSEPRDVVLSLNTLTLVFRRNEEVIVPRGHLVNCARNAQYPLYEQKPGFDRQVAAIVSKYPYSYLRPGTKEEFHRNYRAGNKMQRDAERRAQLEEAMKQLQAE